MTQDHIALVLSILKYGGLIVGASTGVLGTLTKTHREKPRRKITGWGRLLVALTIAGGVVAAAIQGFEDYRGKIETRESQKERQELLTELQDEKKQRTQDNLKLREKIQQVLSQLDAAKREDSKQIADEQIELIQKDFADWADDFVKNEPRIKSNLQKMKVDFEQEKLKSKADFTKKEMLYSQEAYLPFSFAVACIEKSLEAYAKKTGKKITIGTFELPENFYEKHPSPNANIFIDGKAVWTLSINVASPAESVLSDPELHIGFGVVNGFEPAWFSLRVQAEQKKFTMAYRTQIPTPLSASDLGGGDLSDYETPIREAVQSVIAEQLTQALE